MYFGLVSMDPLLRIWFGSMSHGPKTHSLQSPEYYDHNLVSKQDLVYEQTWELLQTYLFAHLMRASTMIIV